MFRFAKWLPCTAAFAATVLFGTARSARADIELTLTEVNTSYSYNSGDVTGDSVGFMGGSVGDFSIFMAGGSSNGFGTTADALVQEGAMFIKNTSSTAETLQIIVSADGFTSPIVPPLTLYDVVNGTTADSSVNAPNVSVSDGTAQGYANTSNVLGDISGPGVIDGSALSFQASGPSTNFSAGSNGPLSGSVEVDAVTAPYSLTFVETFTLSAGGSLTMTDGNLQMLTPEPASLMAALTAVPFLGLGAWRRRRKRAS
ncbi:MAG TPA: hypothetical protein VMG10_17110 [Gemmataceae bacterium]|nr:hypothetical protein [Gemmataceae bacterium]